MHPSVSMLLSLILVISSLTQAQEPMTTTTAPPFEPLTTTDLMMMMMGDDPVRGKSAQINLPGIGEVDLDRLFTLPGLTAPNISLPALPTLPKVFSEVPCVSLSGRIGTCRTVDTCLAGSGLPETSCALGLGVCCTKPFTCGQTIIGNESLITSPGFPEPSTKSDLCTITIMKGLGVVQVRLDLEVFDIAGADSTGTCSEDVMEVVGANPGTAVPKICGMNQGQHIYVPVDKTVPLSPLLIKFLLSKSSTAHRVFKIRVTQLGKDHPDLAPVGCVQYYAGKEGVVRSFNYEHVKNVGIRTIKGLKYGVCFRKEAGHCKVKLEPTYTRMTRSLAAPAAPTAVRYAYYPAQHPIVYRRPVVYLRRPVLRAPYQRQYLARPALYQQRPVPYYPVPPTYYMEKKVDLVEKKEDVLNLLEEKKKALLGLLDKKVDLLGKKEEVVDALMANKKLLIEGLYKHYPGKQVELEKGEKKVDGYGQPSYYYPAGKKVEDKKEKVDMVLARKQELVNELFTLLKIPTLAPLPTLPSLVLPTLAPLPSLTNLLEKLPTLAPLPTVATQLSDNAFGLLVDNDHEELGRGFSIAYKQEEC